MKMFAARFTIALIALCAFCFGVFAEEDKAQVQYEQGRAAVAFTRTKSRSRVVQPAVVETVQTVQKEAPKAAAQPTVTKATTKTETCTSGSCASSTASTETYQKRGSPFRRSSGGGLFGRSRGSCSSGSCGG